MVFKEYIVNIDISRKKNHSIECKQYDNGSIVNLVFTDLDNFLSIDNYSIYVYFKLPNNEVINRECIINNNMATFTIDNEITNLVGEVNTEVVVYMEDNKEISFDSLIINVNKSIRKRV